MMHPRARIRHAAAALLKGVVPEVGDRVHPGRLSRLDEEDLPAILVYTRSEDVERDPGDPDGYAPTRRRLALYIEIVAMAREDVDDRLDTIAGAVEAAMPGLVVDGMRLDRVDYEGMETGIEIDGRMPIGAQRLDYAVTYLTPGRAPGDELPGDDLSAGDTDDTAPGAGAIHNVLCLGGS